MQSVAGKSLALDFSLFFLLGFQLFPLPLNAITLVMAHAEAISFLYFQVSVCMASIIDPYDNLT